MLGRTRRLAATIGSTHSGGRSPACILGAQENAARVSKLLPIFLPSSLPPSPSAGLPSQVRPRRDAAEPWVAGGQLHLCVFRHPVVTLAGFGLPACRKGQASA